MDHAAPSTQKTPDPLGRTVSSPTDFAPVTLGEGGLVTLALARLLFGFLWFQQLAWKMPPDFGGLRQDVEREVHFAIVPAYREVVQQVFLAHFTVLGVGVWTAELLVGLALLFGVFTRLGALLALVLSIQLFLGIAYAPGEWYWAYVMLLMLSVLLVVVPTGRRLGFDQVLHPWLTQRRSSSRLARWLAWAV